MDDAAIAGLIGAGIGALPGIITYWHGRRSQERRHLKELAFKMAIKEWELHNDRIRVEHPGRVCNPLNLYILDAMHLADLIDKSNNISADNVQSIVRQSLDFNATASREFNKYFTEPKPKK